MRAQCAARFSRPIRRTFLISELGPSAVRFTRDKNMIPHLTLPDGTKRSMPEVLAIIDAYRKGDPAVFDLYDLAHGGPHDDVLPVDLLALNALNAWGGGQPMTAMTNAWFQRKEIAAIATPISKSPLEELKPDEVATEAQKVGAALDMIDGIKGYANTATSKLFHRLRPNLGPIWDGRVGQWYQSSLKDSWGTWAKRVYDQVLVPETLECLIAGRKHIGHELSVLRIWDVVLWQARGSKAPLKSAPPKG